MVEIVPTITAHSPAEYAAQLKKVDFAPRLHVDICDGAFAGPATINLAQVYVPQGVKLDLHLMLKNPGLQIESAISLHPHLVIIHTEAEGDKVAILQELRQLKIKAGLAVLPKTWVETIPAAEIDHLLV